jgi:hypothetical protein
MEAQNVTPFANCRALDGRHYHTNSPAKIFHHAGHPLSKEMMKWTKMYDEKTARMILFHIHIFIDIGGTGGGIFRFMYSRFLKEASEITSNPALAEISEILEASGRQLSETVAYKQLLQAITPE